MINEVIWRGLVIIFLVTALSISGYYRRKAEKLGGQLEGPRNIMLVALRMFGLIGIFPIVGYLIKPDAISWFRLPLPESLRWTGAGIALACLPIIWWIFSSIGSGISPTEHTRRDHVLVTDGPYRRVRHPLYSTGFLLVLGISLVSAMWWTMLFQVIALPLLIYRTGHEEAALQRKFGPEYYRYRARTGRFIPRFTL